jgi:Tol biopolymer transport system component
MYKKRIKFRLILLIASLSVIILSCKNGIDIYSSSDIELVQLTYILSDRDQDWSPNGQEMIFVRKTGNAADLWKIDIKTRKVNKMQILGTNPAWHPIKKNTILYQQNGNIFKRGANVEQLTNSSFANSSPAWSPNGNKIVFTRTMDVETIWIMDSDGTNQIQLTTNADKYCLSPAFSYDNTKIVYIKSSELESEINEIWVMNSDGSNKQQLFAPGDTKQTISNRAWNQTGKIIFTRRYPKGIKSSTASDLWIINADGSGAKSVLESYVYSYNSPVWNKQGDKIALNMNIVSEEKTETGANIYFFSYH